MKYSLSVVLLWRGMTKRAILIAIFLVFSGEVPGEELTLSGTITLNKDPYSHLSRSIVYLDSINSGLIDTTDSDGAYSITVSADTYDIYFTHSAYFSDSLMAVIVSSDTTFDEELRLKFKVNSNRPYYKWSGQTNVTLRTFLNVLYNFRVDGRGIIEEFYSPSYNGLWGVQENIRKTTGDTCNYRVYLNLPEMRVLFTPEDSSDARGNTGDIAWDDDCIYIKTSGGWKRATLSAF